MQRSQAAEEKPWGWAEELHRELEGDRVILRTVNTWIDRGGYSSIHLHLGCHNAFKVLSGRLEVKLFVAVDGAIKESACYVLEPGHAFFGVPPGVLHQFEALTNVEVIEDYLAAVGGTAEKSDIVRFSANGKREPAG